MTVEVYNEINRMSFVRSFNDARQLGQWLFDRPWCKVVEPTQS